MPRAIRILASLASLALAAGALDLALTSEVSDASARLLVTSALTNVLIAVSLNVINGMAGQLSIGHAGFVGAGAYTAAVSASHLHAALGGGAVTFARAVLVMPCALALAMGVSAALGLVVGLPSLRLRGDYLAVVTLGFTEIFRLAIAGASVNGGSLLSPLGGANGYMGVGDPPRGVPLYARPFFIALVVGACVAIALLLKRSRWGRSLRAVREDEIAAASVAIDPAKKKVQAFVIAAAGAGAAGALVALNRDGAPIVQPDNFGFLASFDAVVMVVLGGSGSVTGAALGALAVTLGIRAIEAVAASRAMADLHLSFDESAARMIVYATVLIAVMIARPQGLLGEREAFERGGA